MKIKQIIKLSIIAVVAVVALFNTPAYALTTPDNQAASTPGQGSQGTSGTGSSQPVTPPSNGCDYNGAILKGSDLCNSNASDPAQKSAVWGILLLVINILTAGVGIAAIGGIIYGAILWSAAGGNPGQVQKARQIITNVVIGIVAYALMFSFLNFLIPGGIFSTS